LKESGIRNQQSGISNKINAFSNLKHPNCLDG